jgi:hypothetical protein
MAAENAPSGNEETPVPGTVAKDGRREFGAYEAEGLPTSPQIQAAFFSHVQRAFSVERLDAYGDSNVAPSVVLGRYLLNMALCESLYSPLQLCEVALRNSLHAHLSARCARPDWYDSASFALTPWAVEEVAKAKDKIAKSNRLVTPGRVVAELQFGFWTSLFEARYEERNGYLPAGIKAVFPRMPKSLHSRKGIKRDLEAIRTLRNRVFHHERIVHFTDLDAQHTRILDVVGWIRPEVLELARALDRFSIIRREGLTPWLAKLAHHWPHATPVPPPATASPNTTVVSVPAPFKASAGVETPFGHRWGGDVFRLSPAHLAELHAGKTLALDVQNEYVAFLTTAGKGGSHGV